MKNILIGALFLNATAVGAALAGEKCDVPVAEWQPREALQTKLEADGWQIRSIKTEDGCYEAYAVDSKGNKVEAYFDPKTFKRVDGESEG
ncbi:PepSY domain-containing protein [Mesorhizobium tianshanense]|uniref:PepSY domain-containing protein n=1 Tax=Mesorhizobium tianshanense TaxID=39844 RepID=A0A562P507_9HYPH|nr:PepSY domain-containing protein [Mesorhizobium tianshanense]TWI39544.1 hypothetical protein IQ26_01774 [Mesorhizobium tianshanense]